MTNRLFRSRSNSILGGVCAGLGNYFGLDPTIVRLFFVVFTLVNGVGILAYFVLWLVIPLEGVETTGSFEENLRQGADEIAARARSLGQEVQSISVRREQQTGLYLGVALLVLGGVFLLRNLGVSWMRWFDSELIWPALLILAGAWILVRRARGD
ncbi:MAG: hypothetical protein A2Z37_15615 [Chloroflexi bacterium RBG_19FT_COMBO_62_14]|nr:MAG: hypothetical protein A2Z37_15615 [Chloroflexi bacterium RBG_19FT_COMBO_62_14]